MMQSRIARSTTRVAIIVAATAAAAVATAMATAVATGTTRAGAAADGPRRVLRVCADPNNLPFSNARGEGFENRVAQLLAADLHATVNYTWWAQRRGFVRETVTAGSCDVVPGVPSGYDRLLVTRPYYR